jgi:hypothetical protein
MHDNIKQILNAAFWDARGISSFGINDLPKSLTELGGSSLYNAGDGLIITKLPENITTLNAYSLSAGEGVNIDTFGSANKPIKAMAENSLNGSGNGTITKMTIYCEGPGAIQAGAFARYDVQISELNVYSASGVAISSEEIGSWKINCASDVSIMSGLI